MCQICAKDFVPVLGVTRDDTSSEILPPERGRACRFQDNRNILRLGPPKHPGEIEITPAMVESVRQRIKDAGGILTVWAVLHEDVYETQFGDGFYLHAQASR